MQAAEIKAIRTGAGMTQAQFAREIGVDVLSVSRWERGVYRPLPIVQAKIKEAFPDSGTQEHTPAKRKRSKSAA